MAYAGYNGWTNKATWLVNLWMGDYFESCREDGMEIDADFIEASINDMLEDQMPDQSSLMADFINMAIAEVNWRELAAHYQIHQLDPEEFEETA